MFQAFKDSLKPFEDANKLAMVLFQFPPWFDCRTENVNYLRYCKKMMGDIPIALEFRNQSWFNEHYYAEYTFLYGSKRGGFTLLLMNHRLEMGLFRLYPVATNEKMTLIRLHGRNFHGWTRPKNAETNWREVRYLYKYNEAELLEWKTRIKELAKQSKDILRCI